MGLITLRHAHTHNASGSDPLDVANLLDGAQADALTALRSDLGVNEMSFLATAPLFFTHCPTTSPGSGITVLTSGGATATVTPDTSSIGAVQYSTSTGATATVCLRTDTSLLCFGGYEHTFVARQYLSLGLSDGTETYVFRSGFSDNTGGDATDGAYFRYTHSVNGGRYECVTRSNSTETAQDSGVAPSTSSYQILKIVVNSTATSAKFYIDGALVRTITSNIPSGSARAFGFLTGVVKSAGTNGRGFTLDYMGVGGAMPSTVGF